MLQVEVVRNDNRHFHENLLEEQFRVRREVFVDELGWKELNVYDGREIDQFDQASTVYLIVVDEGRVIGGCRLHPTLGPTLLSEIFPDLADVRGFERRTDIWEMTRGFVIRARREERPMRASGAWKAAALEYCLVEGIRSFNGVGETWMVPGLLRMGWQTSFLGLPRDQNGFSLVALNTLVTLDALATTLVHYDLPRPITRWRGLSDEQNRAERLHALPIVA